MKVVQGLNVWRLVRTDRDGVNVPGVLDTLGPVMAFFLRELQPQAGTVKGPEAAIETAVPDDENDVRAWEWRIGAARPIKPGSVTHDEQPLPKGTKLGGRTDLPDVIPTVHAENPWFVNVAFWWRAPGGDIEYPALKLGLFGRRTRDPVAADWYLDKAVAPDEEPQDPGDATWWETQTERISDTVSELAGTGMRVAVGIGALAGMLYLLTRPRR